MRKPILLVDFDGVIHSYESGWKGADVISDAPVAGAFDFLKRALDHFDVQIYSARSKHVAGLLAMKRWFHKHGFDYGELKFPAEKPTAFLTLDDRAICFDGNFGALDPEELLQFKPWNKR